MIAIVDYGVGNLLSVKKAMEKLGMSVVVTSDIEKINAATGIVLPGVGAFKDAIDNLRQNKLVSCLKDNAKKGKPLLGICLGMQLLYETSYEDGVWQGLGLLDGEVVRFNEKLKVPHMGWNNLIIDKKNPIVKYLSQDDFVYFVHSYYVKSSGEDVIAWADYGLRFPAIVGKGNVLGMQFHPEKSGDIGMKLLRAFKEMVKC